MGASSRALAALTLSAGLLVPATAALAVPGEEPVPPTATGAAAGPAAEVPVPQGPPVANASVEVPDFGTASWLLADLDTGEILAARNAEAPVHPASTLKLLTALTVAPRLAPEQPYRAVRADEETEGNRVVLYKGLEYKVSDLMHAALLPSANDAAEALARANGGLDVTVEQMNAEAARVGATRTTARNPSGLDEDGQVTTALDMALIGRAAFANPEIAEYLKLRVVDFPGKREAGARVVYPVYSHNRMLAHPNFVGPIGGKSGYTSKAGRTLVAAADRDGRRLLVTLFHIGGNTYRTGEQLLDWGYANLGSLAPIGTLPTPNAPTPTFDRTITALPGA
ncbi:MAG: serine hydrolase, partial [Candidatus Nanopelagicales bacterium]